MLFLTYPRFRVCQDRKKSNEGVFFSWAHHGLNLSTSAALRNINISRENIQKRELVLTSDFLKFVSVFYHFSSSP